MPPPWVLLHRCVHFIEGGSAGGAGKAAAAAAISGSPLVGSAGGAGKAAAAAAISGLPLVASLDLVATLEEVTAALKPDPVVVDPPEVTSLSMVRHLPKYLMQGMRSGMVSSTDKGLVVLYAGTYRPGNGRHTRSLGYLVYDASSSTLFGIPQLETAVGLGSPMLRSINSLGASAAIIRSGLQDYTLAELVTWEDPPELPSAHLYLWRSSTPVDQTPTLQWLPACRWVATGVCLPLPTELCGPTCFFHIDKAFAFDGRVCWADLLTGVLICDLFASGGPKFSFVPLPPGCHWYAPEEVRLAAKAEEYRSMGVVCGAIKFVDFVGYRGSKTKADVTIKTWTLSSDFKEWKEGPGVLVGDLWESESFRENELPPRGRPMNPVLSMDEDGVIYISLCDIEFVEEHDFLGQCTGMKTVLNGHYALRLDLLQNKVLYSKKSATNCLSLLRPVVVASDFSAYLHDGSKIHQRGEEAKTGEVLVAKKKIGEEASKVGTTVKRTKY